MPSYFEICIRINYILLLTVPDILDIYTMNITFVRWLALKRWLPFFRFGLYKMNTIFLLKALEICCAD